MIIATHKTVKELTDWIGLEIYLAARDGATIRLGVLSEVYEKFWGVKPDLVKMEKTYGEGSR